LAPSVSLGSFGSSSANDCWPYKAYKIQSYSGGFATRPVVSCVRVPLCFLRSGSEEEIGGNSLTGRGLVAASGARSVVETAACAQSIAGSSCPRRLLVPKIVLRSMRFAELNLVRKSILLTLIYSLAIELFVFVEDILELQGCLSRSMNINTNLFAHHAGLPPCHIFGNLSQPQLAFVVLEKVLNLQCVWRMDLDHTT